MTNQYWALPGAREGGRNGYRKLGDGGGGEQGEDDEFKINSFKISPYTVNKQDVCFCKKSSYHPD